MNKKLLVLFAIMLAAFSSAATDEDPTSTSISLDKEVLDSSASSSEDVLDVGDLEYEDEDASSEDGVGRHLRAYNDMGPGMRRQVMVDGRTGGGRLLRRKNNGRYSIKIIHPAPGTPYYGPGYDYPGDSDTGTGTGLSDMMADTDLSDMAYLAIGVVVMVLIVVVVVCVCCKCKKRKQKNNESIEGDEEEGR